VHSFVDEHRSPPIRSVVNGKVVANLGKQTLRGLSGEAEPWRPLELVGVGVETGLQLRESVLDSRNS
jgi:hypothetical protein